jgi:hypothetical protein
VSRLLIDGDVTLTGSGVLTASGTTNNRLSGVDNVALLHNQSDLRLHSGHLLIDTLNIDNLNSISANNGATIHINNGS